MCWEGGGCCVQGGWECMMSTQNGNYIIFPYYEQTVDNFVLALRESVECVEHE